jgi:hypothetical protein
MPPELSATPSRLEAEILLTVLRNLYLQFREELSEFEASEKMIDLAGRVQAEGTRQRP